MLMGIDLGPNLSVTGSFSNDSLAHRLATGEPSGQRVEVFEGRRDCNTPWRFSWPVFSSSSLRDKKLGSRKTGRVCAQKFVRTDKIQLFSYFGCAPLTANS